ncbi:hypothetical protein ACN27G_20430 [Plantactinospora sp. WMMB334]|uniref:hypothetical protein n=1 Tax=Plantactinospora sp. WMMB334 TaxID=3404119 RepID=UPI003B93915C
MTRDEFKDVVLADTRDRLAAGAFITHPVTIGSVSLERSGSATDLVVEFTSAESGQPLRYGWRAAVWPAPDLPPAAVAQHLVSSLVERVEAADAELAGSERDGVLWLAPSPRSR